MQNFSSLKDGYVVDVPYPTFVHRQAMPVWLSALVQFQNLDSPDLSKPYRYLELGCAMGIHLHLTAAANPLGHFVGIDFNAQQLLVAKEGLEVTKIDNIEFIRASFETFLSLEIEPFDFIVSHGVWSWISKDNQEIMVNIINKLLKPNGVLYCSYMSHPGATTLIPVQKLMADMSRNLNGDSATKAVQSLNLVRKLGLTNTGLFEKVPSLNQDLFELAQEKPNYIAHDFLSEHWQPQHSADMIRQFGKIGLSYVAGAGIVENLDALTLPSDVRKIIKKLPLIPLQETVKDIARNTLQRQDIYIKNASKLTNHELGRSIKKIKFGLIPYAPVGQDLKQDPKLGKIADVIEIFEKILVYLSSQHASIFEISQILNKKISLRHLVDIVLVLVWAGYIHPIQAVNHPANFEQAMNTWMQQQKLNWNCIAKYGTAVEN